ncbi:MAG TPA: TlpA disulfide reductase family protein [Candidatus Acidoferrum sp.]|nr:TlpA disulfide reductase family protein [Candidatus Acidoferrum sp.]
MKLNKAKVFGVVIGGLLYGLGCIPDLPTAEAQGKKIEWSDQEAPIVQTLRGMRQLPDDVRKTTTKAMALEIRKLPAGQNKVRLASGLASLSTEGDFGKDALQQVTTTLALAVRETPQADVGVKPAAVYFELASLARYEHMDLGEDLPQIARATQKLDEIDKRRQEANFMLSDLQGKTWTLRELKGNVVLVNFWATWCPPCRKEMPDLEKLYREFAAKGLVVLAISDEDEGKVRPFIGMGRFSYPVLLDPGRKVNGEFVVEGIPKSFLYDRDGKLVAQSIDMRTEHQFREMLALAGLR